MTVDQAIRIHKAAVRNVGKGKGYTHPHLEEALRVLAEDKTFQRHYGD